MKPTVKQHYVPACYLARFTTQGKRDSPFFVYSIGGGPPRESVPNREGFECHYHDVKIAGFPTDYLETFFEKLEAPACALFKTLSENPGRPLLTEAEKDTLVLFYAVQTGRLPQSKKKYEQLVVNSGREFMEAMAHSPEFFARVTAVARRWGMLSEPTDQALLREAVDGGHIKTHADKTGLAVGLLRLAGAVLDRLDGKHYTLWYTDGPEWFICSDYPVGIFFSLSARDTLENPASLENPIIEGGDQTIFMPLAYNVALLVHSFDDRPVVQRANARMVAIVNTITVSHAQRFICSRAPDFTCVLPNKEIGNAADAIAVLRSFSHYANPTKGEGGRDAAAE